MAGEARKVFEKVASAGFSAIPCDRARPGAMAYLAEVCAYLGDEERAAEIHDILFPYAGCAVVAGGTVVCLGSGSRFLGLMSSVRRRWAEAEGYFEEALAFNERLGARPAMVRTQQDYAAMLLKRRRGTDVARAGELTEQALGGARAMGMAGLVEQLKALGQCADAHRGIRANYPDRITARELEVLRLIAEGDANQEIAAELYISERTVHKHVGSILAKTGSANRVEAATYAVRRHLA
jgi:DNA-binding CsgD family transcriptional regulator